MPHTTPYQTIERTIHIPGHEPLDIHTLLDRQQYYDPTGAAERLGICSAAWPLFGMLWPSGIQLAIKVSKRPIASNKRVLEIGCGLAVASIVAHRLGVDVTASDRHPLARQFLDKNLTNNELEKIKYRYGQWGRAEIDCITDTGAPALSERYDIIMGSDLLYDPSSPAQVAAFIHEHATAKSEVWVMDPNRGYRNRFSRKMAKYGFSLEKNKKIQRPFAYNDSEESELYSGRFLLYKRSLADVNEIVIV